MLARSPSRTAWQRYDFPDHRFKANWRLHRCEQNVRICAAIVRPGGIYETAPNGYARSAAALCRERRLRRWRWHVLGVISGGVSSVASRDPVRGPREFAGRGGHGSVGNPESLLVAHVCWSAALLLVYGPFLLFDLQDGGGSAREDDVLLSRGADRSAAIAVGSAAPDSARPESSAPNSTGQGGTIDQAATRGGRRAACSRVGQPCLASAPHSCARSLISGRGHSGG
jgi:hypothetical protein